MILDDALKLRRRGCSVIPIKPKDKKPPLLDSWEPYQKEPPSEDTIREWFQSCPNANLALVTGAVSDCVVIDVDSEEAKTKLKDFIGDFDLTAVPRTRTGKGWQLFFKHPQVTILNRTAVIPGLDVRGDHGYCVVPPSIHPNGKQYKWEVPLNGELPAMPLKLFQLISASTGEGDNYRQRFNTAEALKGVPRGMQRVTVFRLACKLRHADVPFEIAEKLILECAGNCEPPLPEREALEQFTSAYKRYPAGNGNDQPQQPKQAEIWPEFKSAAEILEEPEEEIVWRWDECLPEAGSSLLVAQPKIGKTTLATNLALSVARGLPFLDRKTQQCAVAYAYLDGPRREIKDNFKRLGLNGSDPVYIHAGAAPQDYVAWIMFQVKHHAVRFIIIDTFQKFFRIQNLNDYSEVINKSAPMLDAAAAENVHLMFLHHAGKGDRGDLDSAIGSTALRGQVQSYLHLKLLPESTRRIFRTDQRHGQGNFPEIAIGFDHRGWLEVKGSREDAEIQDTKPLIAEVLDGDELTEKEIRAAVPKKGIIVSKALRQMFKDAAVERTGEGKKHRPFKYSLAALLTAAGFEKSSSVNAQHSPLQGGLLRGVSDSCPIKTIKENSIPGQAPGHESKNVSQGTKKAEENSSPNQTGTRMGHEWDTNAVFEGVGTRIRDSKKEWEDLS
jgi:hypothetical protein